MKYEFIEIDDIDLMKLLVTEKRKIIEMERANSEVNGTFKRN